ncbi:MAG: hypothetical protein ACKVVT_00730 [Dehalococcoidia bacterium]
MAGTSGLGRSVTARAFGADVRLEPGNGRGLALVCGQPGQIEGAIAALGGEVAARLRAGSVLALLSLEAMLALRRHHAVRLAGPVSIDPDRFARFAALAGLDQDPERIEPGVPGGPS